MCILNNVESRTRQMNRHATLENGKEKTRYNNELYVKSTLNSHLGLHQPILGEPML